MVVNSTGRPRSEVVGNSQGIAAIFEKYTEKTARSANEHARARKVLPGGETRSVTFFQPYPIDIVAGHGKYLRDIDGNRYLDLVNNYTSLVHGNADPATVEAIRNATSDGTAYASTHESQVALAETICARVESIERVRFTNSGSEANALALRIARRVTRKRRALVFEGAYHGSLPLLTPEDTWTTVVPFNDINSLAEELSSGDVAAVFAEPFLGAGGVLPNADGILLHVAELARGAGALFVLDEVQSLRNAYGGQQVELGVSPDLTTLGKVIGGGLAIGAVGGRAEILDVLSQNLPNPLHHSGTFNGQVLAAHAGLATLRGLTPEAISEMNRLAGEVANGIEQVASERGIPVSVTRAGSILNLHFCQIRPKTPQEVRSAWSPDLGALHLALLNEGLYTTPRGMFNLSTKVGSQDVHTILEGYSRALGALRG